jgi:hypothetical protein
MYQLDRRKLSQAETLALYRATLAWAAERGTSFELMLDSTAYDDPAELAALRALAAPRPSSQTSDADESGALHVRGIPDARFVTAMTERGAPSGAAAGDESPVECVTIYAGERAVLVSYDYGTVLSVDGGERDLAELRQSLVSAGLSSVRLLPIAPAG